MKTVFVELKIPMCVPTDSTYEPSHNNPSSHHVTITGKYRHPQLIVLFINIANTFLSCFITSAVSLKR